MYQRNSKKGVKFLLLGLSMFVLITTLVGSAIFNTINETLDNAEASKLPSIEKLLRDDDVEYRGSGDEVDVENIEYDNDKDSSDSNQFSDPKVESMPEIPIPDSDADKDKDDSLTKVIRQENKITYNGLSTGQSYIATNDSVKIVFNSLDTNTNNPSLSIEEASVNLNGKNYTGYKFDTEMENGNFSYTLKLPNPYGNEAKVQYSEDGINYKSIDSIVEGSQVIVNSNHFTTFVVTPNPANCNIVLPNGGCFSSLSAAVAAAVDGDVIVVDDADYINEGAIVITQNNLTITSLTGSGTSSNANLTGDTQLFIENGVTNLLIDGLDFRNNTSYPAAIQIVGNTNNLRIINNQFENVSYYGIYARTNSVTQSNISVSNNTFTNIGTSATSNSAIFIYNSDGGTFSNNTCNNINYSCISLDGVNNTNINNNNINLTGSQAIQVADLINPITNVVIESNLISNAASTDPTKGGIRFYATNPGNSQLDILNNTITNSPKGITARDNGDLNNFSAVNINGNNLENNVNGIYFIGNGGFQPLQNNTFTNNLTSVYFQSNDNTSIVAISDQFGGTNSYDGSGNLDTIESRITHNCDTGVNPDNITANDGNTYLWELGTTRGICNTEDFGSNNGTVIYAFADSINLAATKTVNNAFPREGETITYTLRVENNGQDQATNVIYTDVLPAGVTFDSLGLITQGSYDQTTGIWNIGTLDPNQNARLELNVVVNSGTAGTTITNNLEFNSADQTDTNPNDNNDSAVITPINDSINLAATKTVNNAFPREGETITYTLRVENNGQDQATNVIYTDVLPAGVTFDSLGLITQGSYDQTTGIWNIGTLDPNQNARLELNVVVNSGTAGTTITNNLEFNSADQTDTSPNDNNDSVSINPFALVDLLADKTVDNPTPSEGETITYTLRVFNLGLNRATGVVYQDTLPAGVTFVSLNQPNATYDPATRTITWNIGELNNGFETILEIQVSVDPGATALSPITNTMINTQLNEVDNDPTDNNSSISIFPGTIEADIYSSKTVLGNTEPFQGDAVTYLLEVGNFGPNQATNVIYEDILPAGLSFVSANPSQGNYNQVTGQWNIGTLNINQSVTMEIVANVNSIVFGSPIVNNLTKVSADQNDSRPNNDNSSAVITPQERQVDLRGIKTVDITNPQEGQLITYTLRVENLPNVSNTTATNVIYEDILPAGLSFVSANPSQGNYNPTNGIWTVGDLAPNTSATLTIEATVNTGTARQTIRNDLRKISSDQNDSNLANDNDFVLIEVTLSGSDIASFKSVNNDSPYPTQEVIYTLTVVNNGPATATNINYRDILPASVSYISNSTNSGVYDPVSGIWNIPILNFGEAAILEITVRINENVDGQLITNNLEKINQDQVDPDTSNDDSTVTIGVRQRNIELTLDDPVVCGGPLFGTASTNFGFIDQIIINIRDKDGNLVQGFTRVSPEFGKSMQTNFQLNLKSLSNGSYTIETTAITNQGLSATQTYQRNIQTTGCEGQKESKPTTPRIPKTPRTGGGSIDLGKISLAAIVFIILIIEVIANIFRSKNKNLA